MSSSVLMFCKWFHHFLHFQTSCKAQTVNFLCASMAAKIQMHDNNVKEENICSLLGSVVTNTGGAEEDEKICIKKANAAFIQLC